MTIARIFQSGNSQAVRLPKEFRIESSEVEIFRSGDDIVLREHAAKLSELLASLPPLPNDFGEKIGDPLPQERQWLE